MEKETLLQNLLESFCDGAGFKEQDFIRAIIKFIPGESPRQKNAISSLEDAIHFLNEDER